MDATELESTPGTAQRGVLGGFAAKVAALDAAFFRWLASHSLPKAVSLPLVLLVRIGDGYIWALIALSLWLALPLAEVRSIVVHCALTIAISLCLYFPIKFSLRRPRPYDSGMEVTPLVPPLDKYSFPSGHTMNNLSVALTLALHLPNLIVPAILFPVTMGLLRILFGVHYLSDIAGGTVLGATAFFIAKAVYPLVGI
jgi:undecaprenyl-diphosphatase